MNFDVVQLRNDSVNASFLFLVSYKTQSISYGLQGAAKNFLYIVLCFGDACTTSLILWNVRINLLLMSSFGHRELIIVLIGKINTYQWHKIIG